jgi:hypothetical protein
MDHFGMEQWIDFARQVTSPDVTAKMQAHLDAGCKTCARMAKTMTRVADLAGREAGYAPEAGIVRIAKARFGGSGLRAARAPQEFFPLIFDSLTAPAVSGVRIALMTTRQLLYRKDDCSIDIRLEHVPGSAEAVMVGQILESGRPGRDVGSILVELLRDGQVFASTATTGFGEFQFLFPPAQQVELCFGVSSQRVFWIKIPPLETIPEGGLLIKD